MPNGGEALGWLGRFADDHGPDGTPNYIVNVARSQALAVRSARHSPLVFDDPGRLRRQGYAAAEGGRSPSSAAMRRAATTPSTSCAVRPRTPPRARLWCATPGPAYRTSVDYGIGGLGADLRKVAALIQAELPTRIYYVSFRGASFDTHVHQADTHARLLMYMSDAVAGFLRDIERMIAPTTWPCSCSPSSGAASKENGSSAPTTAPPVRCSLPAKGVAGGFYGDTPSLTDLDDGNLKMTTDFRRVYASMIEGWMGMGRRLGHPQGRVRGAAALRHDVSRRTPASWAPARSGRSGRTRRNTHL